MKHALTIGLVILSGALMLYLGGRLLPGKTRAQKRAWLAASALTFCAAAFSFGYCGGGVAMTEIQARLELLWPNFSALPNTDKGLLVGAAIKCHLVHEPMDPAAVVGCIRRGADLLVEHNPSLDATTRIDQLLNSSRLGRSHD